MICIPGEFANIAGFLTVFVPFIAFAVGLLIGVTRK